MANKKKTMTVQVVDPEEPEQMRDEEIDPDDLAMESVGKDFAEGDRTIKLHRYPPGSQGGRPRYLGALIPEDFNEEFVASHYGGGRYFGRWKRKNGTFSRYPFEIEGEPFPVKRERDDDGEEEEQLTVQPTTTLEPARAEMGTADVLRLIAETRRETREEMRMLLEMMKPAPAAPAATEQVFSLVEKIIPLIQSGNSGGDSNPWLFALSQLKDPLIKIVDTVHTAVNRSATVQPVRPAAPMTTTPTSVPVTETPAPPKGDPDMVLDGFRNYLPMLLNAAASGKDPVFYADVILDQVPEFFHPKLKEWLLQPGCLDKIASLDQTVYAQAAWWTELRNALLTELGVSDAIRPVQPHAAPNLTAVPSSARPEPAGSGEGTGDSA